MGVTSSSTTKIRVTLEQNWGELPGGGSLSGNTAMRTTGETLNFNLTKDSSKEMNPQRQIRSLAVTNASAQGDINFEFSFGTYDLFLASAMRSSWQNAGIDPVQGAQIVTTDEDFDLIDLTNAKMFDTQDPTAADPGVPNLSALSLFKAGTYVSVFNFGVAAIPTEANATPAWVDHVRIIENYAGDKKLKVSKGVFGAGVSNMILALNSVFLTIGNDKVSMTIEKQLGENYFSFGGMEVSKMDLSLSAGAFLTGSFSFMGKNGVRGDSSSLPADFEFDAPPFPSMSAVDGVAQVLMNGQDVSDLYDTWIKSMTLSLDNQLEAQTALGVLGSIDNMAKTIQLTGGMSLYLTDGSLYDAFVASETMSLSFVVKDSLNNGYAFVLDKIDFNEMPANASADGQAVMLDSKYTGVMGEDTLNSLTIYALPGNYYKDSSALQAYPFAAAAGQEPDPSTPVWNV